MFICLLLLHHTQQNINSTFPNGDFSIDRLPYNMKVIMIDKCALYSPISHHVHPSYM